MRAGRVRTEITGVVRLEETLARIALRNDRFISSLLSRAREGIELDRKNLRARMTCRPYRNRWSHGVLHSQR